MRAALSTWKASSRSQGRPSGPPGLRLGLLLFLTLSVAILFSGGSSIYAEDHDAPTPTLRTLTTTHQAHSLSSTQALLGYPVHLRGVVTFYDSIIDPRRVALFLHDATGSIFVSVPRGTAEPTPAGSIIDVRGISAMGDFAPIIAQPHILLIRTSHIPPRAPRASLTRLLTGVEDGQWVEVEGVIHSIFETQHNVTVRLAMTDGTVSATTIKEPGADYTRLIDAKVRIHGNAVPTFNSDRQMIGTHIAFPNLEALQVIEPAPVDPFGMPPVPVSSLSRFNPVAASPHRVHVRGIVTLNWPGSSLCIRDGSHGLCAHIAQPASIKAGDLADLVGFATIGAAVPVLSDAIFRRIGQARTVLPQPVTAQEALLGPHDAQLVQIDGQLIGRDLAAADTTLLLASGKFIFAAVLPKDLAGQSADAWKNGSQLRVTGICSVELDEQRTGRTTGAAEPKAFRLLLRSPADVVVLRKPSWWSPGHALFVLAPVLTITLIVLGWIVALRKRLERQTKLIRDSEERFRYMAQHDALTGLPTRLLLQDRLNGALERAKRFGAGLGLLMIDVDNFKLINDSLGHDAGDRTLVTTAQRLFASIRGTDTAARTGGDEFIILLTDLSDPQQAENIAAKIVAALSCPMRVGNRELTVSVSVGVCTAFSGELNADTLLKNVDTALYSAKARGRNCFQCFTDEMARAAAKTLRLQVGLRHALERDEFELHYQPMIDFETGMLTGFEALLRWRSTEMGMVMPDDFIPLAEESGLIIPVGEWVIREACRQVGILEKQLDRIFLLAVNLSPRQLLQPELPGIIERTLAFYGRAPQTIEFEITETMLVSDCLTAHSALLELHRLGVRLAIDDFGVGFSSLSYITRFAFDRIKIDRSFIQDCATDESSLAVIHAIVSMAHGLSIPLVAEGVETLEQFRVLGAEGCETAQGYFVSRPVPFVDLPALLQQLEFPARARTPMLAQRR